MQNITKSNYNTNLLDPYNLKQTKSSKKNDFLKPEDTKQKSFIDHVKDGVDKVNNTVKDTDKSATNLATGKEYNLHETMLRATQADLNFTLLVQLRNKALEAYQEIMRMPV